MKFIVNSLDIKYVHNIFGASFNWLEQYLKNVNDSK